jgi:hypothetical protein
MSSEVQCRSVDVESNNDVIGAFLAPERLISSQTHDLRSESQREPALLVVDMTFTVQWRSLSGSSERFVGTCTPLLSSGLSRSWLMLLFCCSSAIIRAVNYNLQDFLL